MAVPIDLNQARAARAEEELEPYEVSLGDETFTIPHPKYWSRETMNALAAEDLEYAFELLLGPEQWPLFLKQSPDFGDYMDLMDGLERGAGMAGPGERRRPGRSSKSTGGPSKRTSTATTGSSSRKRPGQAGRNLRPAERPAGTSGA